MLVLFFRLHSAMLTNRPNVLTNQAKSESLLLSSYNIKIQDSEETKQIIITEAVKILEMFSPVMNSAYYPTDHG